MDTKKQKVIKVLKRIGIALSIGFNVLFLIAIIVGSSGIKNKSNNVQVACAESEVIKVDSHVNKKFVSYDDGNYSISFTSDEFNNYIWSNLTTYFTSINSFDDDSNISYNSVIFSNYSLNNGKLCYFALDESSINFNDSVSNKFTYVNSLDEALAFEYSINWYIGATYYDDVKSAIELDIQANSSNINDGIFETLTSGVVAFIGSISSGITAMTSVFYDSANSQLTAIGLLSVIVVAISLAYFLFRLIIGLIRMRG